MSDLASYPAATALAEIQTYRMLSNGWDGPDSLAPQPAHLNLAATLFKAWPSDLVAPTAMVGSDGTVGMYWSADRNNGLYIDAEYDEHGQLSVFARRHHDHHERFQEHLSPEDGLNTLLHWVRHGL